MEKKVQNKSFEILSRREIIFLHVPKTGTSSIWHSLANANSQSISSSISIRDAHHEVLQACQHPMDSLKFLRIILEDHIDSLMERLIVHYHYPFGNLQRLMPLAGIVVIYRNPNQRLRSGFRHWRAANSNIPCMYFFDDFASKGVNHYLSNCLRHSCNPFDIPPNHVINNIKENIVFFNLQDYVMNNSICKNFFKYLGFDNFESLIYPGTVTDISLNQELDSIIATEEKFRNQWEIYLKWEQIWHEELSLQ
jgi:hypothetical protein